MNDPSPKDSPAESDEPSSECAWHARTVDDVLQELQVEPEEGLSADEVDARLEAAGPNRLRKVETRPWWRVLLEQFRSIVIYLLAGAAVLAFATGRFPEALAVLAVLAVNTALGFASEWKAVRSMAALRKLGDHTTRVRRSGTVEEISAAQVVPGDIVLLEAGMLVERLVSSCGVSARMRRRGRSRST